MAHVSVTYDLLCLGRTPKLLKGTTPEGHQGVALVMRPSTPAEPLRCLCMGQTGAGTTITTPRKCQQAGASAPQRERPAVLPTAKPPALAGFPLAPTGVVGGGWSGGLCPEVPGAGQPGFWFSGEQQNPRFCPRNPGPGHLFLITPLFVKAAREPRNCGNLFSP